MSNPTHLISLAEQASKKLDLAFLRIEQAQDLVDELKDMLAKNSEHAFSETHINKRPLGLALDHSTYSVVWRGKTTMIGPTLAFSFLETLSRRPNRFYTYEQLSDLIWDGAIVADGTIRGVARDLRQHLKSNGMPDLAKAIEGKMKTYGLVIGNEDV
ncbi:MAG: hypothetical protein ACPGYV_01045 [Phycisphaeraceae bacterium]